MTAAREFGAAGGINSVSAADAAALLLDASRAFKPHRQICNP
jgi:hypothetical protein